MANDPATRRLIQVGALFLIGNGFVGLLKPRWHPLWWRFGPQLVRAATEELADHPKTARSIYLAEAALGIILISRHTPGQI